MKKLSAIFLVLVFAVSLFVTGCTASGGVSVGKQQNAPSAKTISK